MAWANDAHALCGGRVMRPETLHVTLAFLGSTPAARVAELVRAVPGWQARTGAMTLRRFGRFTGPRIVWAGPTEDDEERRSEEHTSELQSLMRISYAVFCLKKKKDKQHRTRAEHRRERAK